MKSEINRRRQTMLIRGFPPSANLTYLPGRRNGSRIMSKEYREFLTLAKLDWSQCGQPRLASGFYVAKLFFFPPDRRWFDLDNRIKPTFDALTKIGFWEDDRFVRRIVVVRDAPVENGAVAIIAESVERYETSDPRELGLKPYQTVGELAKEEADKRKKRNSFPSFKKKKSSKERIKHNG